MAGPLVAASRLPAVIAAGGPVVVRTFSALPPAAKTAAIRALQFLGVDAFLDLLGIDLSDLLKEAMKREMKKRRRRGRLILLQEKRIISWALATMGNSDQAKAFIFGVLAKCGRRRG